MPDIPAEMMHYIYDELHDLEDEHVQIVAKIKHHIDKHYMNDLPLEKLAELVHLSPSYLSRLFKRIRGENLSSYIQKVRIEEAKKLLEYTSLKVFEVGEKVGIPDPVYFSRIFKKITGVKPKDY
ncbi:MAG: AraC family transcriptional regulator [Lachnospiraceae bacterium]|nr:AraC family transcriptional regulator [Lachnospiraceae bacterium]